jgi:hypothetical protein
MPPPRGPSRFTLRQARAAVRSVEAEQEAKKKSRRKEIASDPLQAIGETLMELRDDVAAIKETVDSLSSLIEGIRKAVTAKDRILHGLCELPEII